MKRARSCSILYEDEAPMNIMYFEDVMIHLCQFFTIKQLLKLEELSWFHAKLIKSTPMHQEFKPGHQFQYANLIHIIKHHQFKNLNLYGTFLHNKHVSDLGTPLKLDISNTFVNEKCLDLLKGPYEKIVLPREVLKYVFSFNGLSIDQPFNEQNLTVYKNLINAVSASGNTALIEYLSYYPIHDKYVQYMIDQHIDVNAKNNTNFTALHYAIEKNHLSSIKILLNHSAIVDESHVRLSITLKNPMITTLLCDHLDQTTCHCCRFALPPNCLLSLAIYYKLDVVNALIKKSDQSICALQMSVYMENIQMINLLLQYGVNPLLSKTVLIINAVNKNNYEIVNILSKYDINIQNLKCRTAVMHAAKYHNMKMVKHLVVLGADTNLVDKWGNNLLLLYLAQDDCHLKDIYFLLTICDINTMNDKKINALMMAIMKRHDDIITYLINHIDMQHVNDQNQNALTVALEHYPNIDMIKAMVDKGVDLTLIDNQSFPIFINALHYRCPDVVIDYLLELRIDDVCDRDGTHALIYMIHGNYSVKLVSKMIERYNNPELIKKAYKVTKQTDFLGFVDLMNNLQIFMLLKKLIEQ